MNNKDWQTESSYESAGSIQIRQVTEPAEKEQIAMEILTALPEWFGIPESRDSYIQKSRDQVFFAAEKDRKAVGFLCLKETGPSAIEIAVMGVRKQCHRHGIGKALFGAAREYAVRAGYAFMQVKTVQMGCYEEYDRTNRFYLSVGFRELEVFPDLWDRDNPCQVYILYLGSGQLLTDLILHRRSYRGQYTSEKVSREDLRTIMEAGLAAPSGCNRQTVQLIAVDDPDVLSGIHAVIDPPVAETAPALICVLSQKIMAYRDRCFATQDYAAAIENMLLAVTALGYQSCWYEGHITDTDRICDRIAQILHVPDETELVCILPVGRAVSDPTMPAKKSFSERAWFNRFPDQ